MNNLWIGYNTDEYIKSKVLSNGGKFLSGKISQDCIYDGLMKNGLKMDSININQIAAFPQYKEFCIKEHKWKKNGNNVNVGYLNVKYLNIITKKIALKRAVKKWAKQNRNDNPTVFVYSMHSPLIAAAAQVKKVIPNAKIVLLVPDLPEYMDLSMSRLKKMLKAVDKRKIRSLMKYVDSYVLYAAPMAEKLQLKDNQWMVMEGLYDIKNESGESENGKYSDGEKTVIMYSGLLEMKYGIGLLIEAFSGLEGEKYELWISGSGKEDCLKYIEKAAMQDKRIKYLGYFDSLDELKQRQRSATMMINMRLPSEEASRYCFPSKLFDYLMSAKPVLSFKLGGIPEEYNDKLVQIEEETPEAIRNAIQKVETMKPEERDSLGEKAVKFVAEGKNSNAQTQRILDFLQKSCK